MVRQAANAANKAWSTFTEKIAPALVVAAITVMVGFGFNTGDLANKNSRLIEAHSRELESIKEAESNAARVIARLAQDIAVIQAWKASDFFTGERYDLARGSTEEAVRAAADKRLEERIAECREERKQIAESVSRHHEEAERWKQRIVGCEADIADIKKHLNGWK